MSYCTNVMVLLSLKNGRQRARAGLGALSAGSAAGSLSTGLSGGSERVPEDASGRHVQLAVDARVQILVQQHLQFCVLLAEARRLVQQLRALLQSSTAGGKGECK